MYSQKFHLDVVIREAANECRMELKVAVIH